MLIYQRVFYIILILPGIVVITKKRIRSTNNDLRVGTQTTRSPTHFMIAVSMLMLGSKVVSSIHGACFWMYDWYVNGCFWIHCYLSTGMYIYIYYYYNHITIQCIFCFWSLSLLLYCTTYSYITISL